MFLHFYLHLLVRDIFYILTITNINNMRCMSIFNVKIFFIEIIFYDINLLSNSNRTKPNKNSSVFRRSLISMLCTYNDLVIYRIFKSIISLQAFYFRKYLSRNMLKLFFRRGNLGWELVAFRFWRQLT